MFKMGLVAYFHKKAIFKNEELVITAVCDIDPLKANTVEECDEMIAVNEQIINMI